MLWVDILIFSVAAFLGISYSIKRALLTERTFPKEIIIKELPPSEPTVEIISTRDGERWKSPVKIDHSKPGYLIAWRYPEHEIGVVHLDEAKRVGTYCGMPVVWERA